MRKKDRNIIIGVDVGNAYTKTANIAFISGLDEVPEEFAVQREYLKYGGKYYVTAKSPYEIRDNKADLDFLGLILFGIGKEFLLNKYSGGNASIHLVLGLPPGKWAAKDEITKISLQRALKDFYSRDFQFEVDGEAFNVLVEKVSVFPQAFSALYALGGTLELPDAGNCAANYLYGEPSLIVADLGGGTVDAIALNNGIMALDPLISLDMGTGYLADRINNKIASQTGRRISRETINGIFWKGNPDSFRASADVKSIIAEQTEKYLTELLAKLKNSLPLDESYVIFTGGAASRFEAGLTRHKNMFGVLDFIFDRNANAKGYETVAADL